MTNITIIIIFLFSLIFIACSPKAKNQFEYITAGKKTKTFYLVSTLVMTEINPMALITLSALGYTIGYRALTMALIAFLSPLIAAITTAKKWKSFNSTCVSILFDQYLGYKIGNVVRIILLFSLIILTSTYIKGVIIFSKVIFPNVPVSVPILIVLLFCVFSVMTKGLVGIIRMDVVGFFLTIGFSLECLISSYLANFHQALKISIPDIYINPPAILSPRYLTALFFLQLMMYSIAPWWGQKIFSANDSSIAYKSCIYSSFILFIFYSFIIISAIFLRQNGVILRNPELAFPTLLLVFGPATLITFNVIAFFYIATTTICGVWSAILTMITSGFLKTSDDASLSLNYLVWSLLGIITYYIALNNIDNLLHAAVLAVMQMCSIYFSVLAIFYFKRISKLGALVSIFSSIIIGYVSLFYFGEEGDYIWYWIVIGIPVMFLSGYSLSGFSNIFRPIKQ